MKKFLPLLFLLFLASMPASAVVTTEEVRSEAYIRAHGHSEEMAKLMDLQFSQINGAPRKFVRKSPDWYQAEPFLTMKKTVLHFDKTPEDNILNRGNLNEVQPFKFVRSLFMYTDKTLEDGKFMQNNIDYTNRYDDL